MIFRNSALIGILCFSSSTLFAANLSASLTDPIIGGSTVSEDDPLAGSVIALVRTQAGSQSLCSATLIARDMALTAAHCVADGVDGTVLVFSTDIHAPNAKTAPVLAAEVPLNWGTVDPDRSPEKDIGDIAVVHFEGDLPTGYAPAKLMPEDWEPLNGDEALLAGYGITDAASHDGAGVMRKVSLPIEKIDFSETEVLFDQRAGSGACHGDSGGPAFLVRKDKLYLFAETSRGYPNAAPDDCKHQVIYTKTAPYRHWISAAERKLRSTN